MHGDLETGRSVSEGDDGVMLTWWRAVEDDAPGDVIDGEGMGSQQIAADQSIQMPRMKSCGSDDENLRIDVTSDEHGDERRIAP